MLLWGQNHFRNCTRFLFLDRCCYNPIGPPPNCVLALREHTSQTTCDYQDATDLIRGNLVRGWFSAMTPSLVSLKSWLKESG